MNSRDVGRRGHVVALVHQQRHVERRAADVGAEHVAQADLVRKPARPDDAADRPGDERRRELVSVDRDGSTVRGHHPQLEARAGSLGAFTHGAQRAPRRLGRVALDDGGVEAREVAPHRVELGGDEERDLAVERARGLLLLEDLAHARLVTGVAVGEQEGHADALDRRVEQRAGGFAHVFLAQRQHLVAEQVDPAADTVDALARHQRRIVVVGGDVQPVGVGVAEVGLDAALHLQRVLLTGGDDHADVEAFAREQSVQHCRAAEHSRANTRKDLVGHEIPLAQRVVDRVHQPGALVVGRRLCLPDDEASGLVDDECICHRAAGVDRKHSWRMRCRRHQSSSVRVRAKLHRDDCVGKVGAPEAEATFLWESHKPSGGR